jgi:hypothetical protein
LSKGPIGAVVIAQKMTIIGSTLALHFLFLYKQKQASTMAKWAVNVVALCAAVDRVVSWGQHNKHIPKIQQHAIVLLLRGCCTHPISTTIRNL